MLEEWPRKKTSNLVILYNLSIQGKKYTEVVQPDDSKNVQKVAIDYYDFLGKNNLKYIIFKIVHSF